MSRAARLGMALALTVVATGVWGSAGIRTEAGAPRLPEAGKPWEERVSRDPYDYEARGMLVSAYRGAGQWDRAFLEAAWLAWLAPREYAQSEQGLPYLRDRRAQDRAAKGGEGGVQVALAAVEVRRWLYDCCANGAIAQQATRLRTEVEEVLFKLGEARRTGVGPSAARPTSAVARMAMADIYLTLDDVLVLEGATDSQRARTQALRSAASQAEAAQAAAPEAPGPHRVLAVIRSRLAELSGASQMWGLAIVECEQAYCLDPRDTALPEMLWALALHAGRWEEARRWEAVVAGESVVRKP